MKKRIWFLGLAGLLGLYWEQPYFGWRYCMGEGFLNDRDLVAQVRGTLLWNYDRLHSHANDPAYQKFRQEIEEMFNNQSRCVEQYGWNSCNGRELENGLSYYMADGTDGWWDFLSISLSGSDNAIYHAVINRPGCRFYSEKISSHVEIGVARANR